METEFGIEAFRGLSPASQRRFLDALTDEETAMLEYDWDFWARPEQRWPAGLWRIWLVLTGRGWGKTRTGAETIREAIEKGGYGRINLVGATAADVRDVMIEGESGILAISPPWNRPKYEPSKRRLTWPNGAVALCFSADEPDRLRGPQCDFAWCDELAACRRPDAWNQLMFGLRLGRDPRCIVTTTPKPTQIIRELVKAETTHVTRGTTYENRDNLAGAFFDQIIRKYEGTRLGRQELLAEILEDTPGALWTWEMIGAARLPDLTEVPAMKRIVVAVDPAVSNTETSDETGILVCGLGEDGRGYVLCDASGKYSPDGWARRALGLYYEYRADRIIAERNNGGDMVENVIRTADASASVKTVWASRGKTTRAEPVTALYEQGRISHAGEFPELEDQLTGWTPGMKSPDRLDALVWALTELMVEEEEKVYTGRISVIRIRPYNGSLHWKRFRPL